MPTPFMSRLFLLTLLSLAAALPSARAVVVALSDDPAYTLPPPVDDFGFASVGTVHNSIAGIPASGVYLGDSWVISAFHNVSNGGAGFLFGPIVFGGLAYSADPTTATRLHNPDNSLADLAIFRLTSEPTALSASLSGTTPLVQTDVRMMGNGQDRASSETSWVVVGNSWTEVGTSGGNRTGCKLVGTRALRWGTNEVETSAALTPDFGFGKVVAFTLDFDREAGEGMATGGDSGGGVFVKNGTEWTLAGIMIATTGFAGQPLGTVVYDNVVYAANIATYKAEIQATVASVPEPASLALLLSGVFVLARRRSRNQR
jgi:hypothetical protein